jgi:hypothetical protein
MDMSSRSLRNTDMELVKPPSAGKVRELAPLVTGNTWCIRGDTALFRRIRYIKSRVLLLLLLLLRRVASRHERSHSYWCQVWRWRRTHVNRSRWLISGSCVEEREEVSGSAASLTTR